MLFRSYQKSHPSVKLILVTPYLTEDYQKSRLNAEKESYDAIVYPELEHIPLKFAISHRNRWMVEQADFVVARIDHGWGGAYETCLHAKRRKKPILFLGEKRFF